MTNVNLTDLLAATNGQACGFHSSKLCFSNIGIDSRTIGTGELFWAIPGERHDRHNFIHDALDRGAVACVVERDKYQQGRGPAICVDNTLTALGDYAAWHRRQHDALVVGVTGSFGKTTTREMIHAVLSAEFSGTQSPHNYNNHIGLPLSLLNVQPHDEFAVLELGASHIGEIRRLAETSAPEIGVVTGIGIAHLDGFGSLERIIEAKGELLEQLPESGFAVLNGDDGTSRQLADRASCPVILVGENRDNQFHITHLESDNETIRFRIDRRQYAVSATGRHHVRSAAAAVAVAREIGMKPDTIAEGLRSFRPVSGRCRLETIGNWYVIDDTYNANPHSMEAACNVLGDWQGNGKRILIAGDMLELGTQAHECHRRLGRLAAEVGVDRLIVHGGYSSLVIEGAIESGLERFRLAQCESFDALTTVLDCWLDPEDVVLVKGSRNLRMERVIDWMKELASTCSDEPLVYAFGSRERICA